MGPAVDALEAAILDRKLKHGSHPFLTWNCWNSVVEIDPTGARKVDKAKSTERVDGMVTLAMAVGLASRSPKPEVFEPRLMVLTAQVVKRLTDKPRDPG
jgi:phage terminase large subunit-like protein